jgi:hypothetical protein
VKIFEFLLFSWGWIWIDEAQIHCRCCGLAAFPSTCKAGLEAIW